MCSLFTKKDRHKGFGKKITDLIKTKHNSNHKTQQTALTGEIVQEYTYYLLGFVSADVVRFKKDVWFTILSNEQIKSVEEHLQIKKFAWD